VTGDQQQASVDTEHLRILRIGYIFVGALNGFFALFPLIHVTVGLLLLFGVFSGGREGRFIGPFFVALGVTFSTMLATLSAVELMTARRIRQRRSRTFCLITAGLTCMQFPFGTALGVFTILVFNRPSVAALFSPSPSS
jgi:hypothetical protein